MCKCYLPAVTVSVLFTFPFLYASPQIIYLVFYLVAYVLIINLFSYCLLEVEISQYIQIQSGNLSVLSVSIFST